MFICWKFRYFFRKEGAKILGISENRGADPTPPSRARVFERPTPKPEISVDFSNTHGRQQYSLYMYFTDISQLPAYATKANACDRMDVVMYELDSPEKEYRLHFKRGGNGWVAFDDLGARPKLSNPSTLEFFLHCHWRGEVRPGNTISIPYVR